MTLENYKIGLGDLILRASGGFYYMASPYTHEDHKVTEQRVELAHEYFSLFTSFGLHLHNATYETHRAARTYRLPTHFQFWLEHNSAFIRPAIGIIIAEIDGWEESKGIKSEIEEGRTLGKPIYGAYLNREARIMFIREMFSGRLNQETN